MRYSSFTEYSRLFSSLKNAFKLKRLLITVNLRNDLIEILNKNIGKDANFKSLSIYFANYQPVTAATGG